MTFVATFDTLVPLLPPHSDDHNHTQSGRREPDLCLRKCLILPANWLQKEDQHIPCRAIAAALANLASLRFSCEEVPEKGVSHELARSHSRRW
jgi:hypothetical protein